MTAIESIEQECAVKSEIPRFDDGMVKLQELIIVQEGHVLHPVEIKMGMQVGADAVKGFALLEDIYDYEVGFGHVICQTKAPYFISKDVQVMPVWAIWLGQGISIFSAKAAIVLFTERHSQASVDASTSAAGSYARSSYSRSDYANLRSSLWQKDFRFLAMTSCKHT